LLSPCCCDWWRLTEVGKSLIEVSEDIVYTQFSIIINDELLPEDIVSPKNECGSIFRAHLHFLSNFVWLWGYPKAAEQEKHELS